jgi:DNA-binding transcriptional regulator YdaS (Cro superfamily)
MFAFRAHIERAVQIHGSQAKLAEAAGCSQQQISYLLHEADRISAEMAAAIDRATEGKVARQVLRPDIFGPAVSENAA